MRVERQDGYTWFTDEEVVDERKVEGSEFAQYAVLSDSLRDLSYGCMVAHERHPHDVGDHHHERLAGRRAELVVEVLGMPCESEVVALNVLLVDRCGDECLAQSVLDIAACSFQGGERGGSRLVCHFAEADRCVVGVAVDDTEFAVLGVGSVLDEFKRCVPEFVVEPSHVLFEHFEIAVDDGSANVEDIWMSEGLDDDLVPDAVNISGRYSYGGFHVQCILSYDSLSMS